VEQVVVTDQEGRRVHAELLSGGPDEMQRVRLEDGRTLLIPSDVLVRQQGGDYYLLGSWDELEGRHLASEEAVIPVVREELRVETRPVKRGGVRVHKRVVEREEMVDEAVAEERVEVERVSVGRLVDAPESARTEGDTIIIPLYEEVLVVEKRLMLTEEVRVTKTRTERREQQPVRLRHEEVTIERLEEEGSTM